MVLVNIAVGQNQYVGTVAVSAVDIHKQAVDGLLQIGIFVVADGERLDLEAGHVHGLDLEQVGLGQDRVLDFQDLAVVGVLLQKIALRTDVDGGRGDDLLAQRRYCYNNYLDNFENCLKRSRELKPESFQLNLFDQISA